jgi:hypothetical protein
MTVMRKALLSLLATAGLAGGSVALAQTTTTLTIDNCRGEVNLQDQRQNGQQLELDVAVAIADCSGVCTGSLEYTLRLQDANGRDNVVHLTENWHWREVQEAFTLTLKPAIAPGLNLQEVVALQIGRCSCSTGQITNKVEL